MATAQITTNFLAGDTYQTTDLQNQFAAINSDGVVNVAGGNLAISISGNSLMLTIAAGSCFRNGLFLINSSIITNNNGYQITANTSGYNRIDVVYADLDANTISIVEGQATGTPTVPALPVGNTLALAHVAVGNGVNALIAANITDVRVNASMVSNITDFARSSNLALLNGYQKLPGGLILQWGTGTANASSTTAVVFSFAFPTACINVVCSPAAGNTNASLGVQAIGAASWQCNNLDTSNRNLYYQAVGY